MKYIIQLKPGLYLDFIDGDSGEQHFTKSLSNALKLDDRAAAESCLSPFAGMGESIDVNEWPDVQIIEYERPFERSIKAVEQFAKSAPRFRVTEGMLEMLDDYLASRGQHGTKEEGQAALRRHFPRLTGTQIESCLRRWRKEMNAAGEQVVWGEDA